MARKEIIRKELIRTIALDICHQIKMRLDPKAQLHALEHALDLKTDTLIKEGSPELLALLKILQAFPWMVNVADKRFDPVESQRELLHAAVDIYCNKEKERP